MNNTDIHNLFIYYKKIPHTGDKVSLNSSTDTTVGWTNNTQKPNVLEKTEKNHPKGQKLKNF